MDPFLVVVVVVPRKKSTNFRDTRFLLPFAGICSWTFFQLSPVHSYLSETHQNDSLLFGKACRSRRHPIPVTRVVDQKNRCSRSHPIPRPFCETPPLPHLGREGSPARKWSYLQFGTRWFVFAPETN